MIQINLVDMTGKVAVSKTEAVASYTKATLSVSHLKQGIYFLIIDIEGNLINRKVIIQ